MRPGMAAFDFDGTIASGDAVMPFVASMIGWPKTARCFVSVIPLYLRTRSRDVVKAAFVKAALTGQSEESLRVAGKRFARHLHVDKVHSTVQECIDWHRNQNHRLVIVSASLDLYLKPLGEMMGFDDVLCTKIEFEDGVATGRLQDGNVRGEAKARALTQLVHPGNAELWAYGNSGGDVAMLSQADHAYWVNRSGEVHAWPDRTEQAVVGRKDR